MTSANILRKMMLKKIIQDMYTHATKSSNKRCLPVLLYAPKVTF